MNYDTCKKTYKNSDQTCLNPKDFEEENHTNSKIISFSSGWYLMNELGMKKYYVQINYVHE